MKGRFSFWLFSHLLLSRGRYVRIRLIRSAMLIALVMIPLILASIFMDGMMRGITDKYIMLQDGHIQLHHRSPLLDNPQRFSDIDKRIISGDYVVSGYGIIYSRDQTAEVRVKGVDPSYFTDQRRAQLTLTGPAVEKRGNLATVMLSETLAERLGVTMGERVAFMIVPDSTSSVVRPVLAEVGALYASGYHELDGSLIFMNREDALRYFPAEKNAYTELLVHRNAVDLLDQIIDRVQQELGLLMAYATWDEFNATVYQNFITSRQVILLVFVMILLVAGVYVSSIAQEMIQDSMQAIALYKTLGARTISLSGAYYAVVMVITIIGMIIGVGIGIGIGLRIANVLAWLSATGLAGLQYYLLDFPVVVSTRDILMICLTMLGICTGTVFISLLRIRRISPLELLQQD